MGSDFGNYFLAKRDSTMHYQEVLWREQGPEHLALSHKVSNDKCPSMQYLQLTFSFSHFVSHYYSVSCNQCSFKGQGNTVGSEIVMPTVCKSLQGGIWTKQNGTDSDLAKWYRNFVLTHLRVCSSQTLSMKITFPSCSRSCLVVPIYFQFQKRTSGVTPACKSLTWAYQPCLNLEAMVDGRRAGAGAGDQLGSPRYLPWSTRKKKKFLQVSSTSSLLG